MTRSACAGGSARASVTMADYLVGPGHPVAAQQQRYEDWGYSWDNGLAALTSDFVRDCVRANDIRLCYSADVWGWIPAQLLSLARFVPTGLLPGMLLARE